MKNFFIALSFSLLAVGTVVHAQNTVIYEPDAEITQVNNLRIQSVSSTGLPATITATTEFNYLSDYYSRTYTIQVDSQTTLLQRNRARLAISQFQVGDRINVYGFLSSYNNSMEALIMRNLDYPRRQTATQLNNLQVTTAPGASAPSTFTAQTSYYPYTSYTIEVSASTQVLDVNRNTLALSQIRTGDYINVYGMLSNTTMRAGILRDLSRTASNTGGLDITTNSSLQAQTGVWFEAEFKVTGGNIPYTIYSSGSETIPGLSFSQGPNCPPGAYCAMYLSPDRIYLRGTPTTPGTYRIAITAQDSCPSYQTCYDYYNQTRKEFTLTVIGSGQGGGYDTPIIQSVTGPSVVYAGQSGTWSISARDPEAGQLSYSVRWGDENIYYYSTVANSQIVMPPNTSTSATFSHTYSSRGTYTIVFTVTDAQGLSTTSTLTVNVQ